ncbi:MAG TPA: FG-GAP-like repeat-containing protein [Nitrosomonas sp.]|nr:FG-GAP-like repeat-containing protein [Nitrosomonas sp.]
MANPVFTYTSSNAFGLSNAGFLAHPTLVDIDGDKDLDAFIGDYYGNVQFSRNTGTINNPVFANPIANPFGLKDVGFNANPTFVDIDGDGDLDAFVGKADYPAGGGDTIFFKNTGNIGNPVFAAPVTNPFGLRDVGFSSSPSFADIDDDGDLDAFIGTSTGNLLFFGNTGSRSNPVFAAPVTNPFGLSTVGSDANPEFADIDGDGDLDAIVGGYGGTSFFRNTETASDPVFVNIGSNLYGLLDVGGIESPTLVDIDGDGDLDAFVGDSYAYRFSNGGNTHFFVNNGLLVTSTAGNNVLTGTPSPNDTATYASAGSGVTVSLLLTAQQNTVGAGLDTLTNIENLIGSKFNDNLTGDMKNNILTGGAGNDTLRGWNGADTMNGGVGNDSYFVENAGDKVVEAVNQGTDSVSSRLTFTLPANVENLTLTDTSAINGTGNGLANVMAGNVASNQLSGLAGNDILSGGGGNDILMGGAGTNILTGGVGNDIFRFTASGNTGTVTDYNVANDTIQLENGVFKALTATGTLPASQFRVGAQALDGNDHVIYNKTTGALIYDANGNGAGAAVQIGTLTPGLNLTNLDIVVI